MRQWSIHVLFVSKWEFSALGGYLSSVSLLGWVQNVCLLAKEHIASIRYIFCNLGSGSTIFDSETCIWAIIRLENDLRRLILLICSVRGLSVTSNGWITERCIILQDAWILHIRIWKPIHLVCLRWAQLEHLTILIFRRNRSDFTVSIIIG